MAKKSRKPTPTVPQKPKDRTLKMKLPDAPRPRKGHPQAKPGAGAHKPKDHKGNMRQMDRARLNKGEYPDADS